MHSAPSYIIGRFVVVSKDSMVIHSAAVRALLFVSISCFLIVLWPISHPFSRFFFSEDETLHPCQPTPCGTNAVCHELEGVGSCSCISEYYGDPYIECRPECIMNSDCPWNRACVNQKCVDPCPGTCGTNAICQVINHSPICTCLPTYVGNPLFGCSPQSMKFSLVLIRSSVHSKLIFDFLLFSNLA